MRGIWLSILVLTASMVSFADKGGNSSGGDEVYGAGTLPVTLRFTILGGVVESITPDPASGKLAPYYRLKFSRLFVGTDTGILISGRHGYGVADLKKGNLIFASPQPAHYNVGDTTVWIGHKPWPGGLEQERAIETYLASDKPEDRFRWTETHLGNSFGLLSLSAWIELESLSRGPLRQKVLDYLLADTNHPRRVQILASSYVKEAKVAALLKTIALDPNRPIATRWMLADRLMDTNRALIEAWKDGKDGADGLIQGRAKALWDRLNPPPPAKISDAAFEKLQRSLTEKPKDRVRLLRDAATFAYEPRLFALYEKTLRDETISVFDRQSVLYALRQFPVEAVGTVLGSLALDPAYSEEFRLKVILALGMGGYPNRKALLERIAVEAKVQKHREFAAVFAK